MHALLVGHYFNGGAYPVGGSSQIAATILPGIERAGGAVITSAEVERVLIERGRAVVYAPGYWRWIMRVIRSMPDALFRRLSI